MNMDIIGGKGNKFSEAVTLSLLGCDVAIFEQPFHKVIESIPFTPLLMLTAI